MLNFVEAISISLSSYFVSGMKVHPLNEQSSITRGNISTIGRPQKESFVFMHTPTVSTFVSDECLGWLKTALIFLLLALEMRTTISDIGVKMAICNKQHGLAYVLADYGILSSGLCSLVAGRQFIRRIYCLHL